MPAYSLLFIDENNAINHSKRVECVSDREAVDIASRECGAYKAVEVWAGGRPLSVVGNLQVIAG